MLKIICDRCGADMTGKSGVFGEIMIRMHNTPDFCSPFKWAFGEDVNEHYCEECVDEITKFIRKPPTQPDKGNSTEPTPQEGQDTDSDQEE